MCDIKTILFLKLGQITIWLAFLAIYLVCRFVLVFKHDDLIDLEAGVKGQIQHLGKILGP